ncbi:MAG: hypothetical protein ACRDKI_02580 [Solirubrobacterales bacterium]
MSFEPGQLTQEADALTHERLAQARAELDAERDFDVSRRCPECDGKLTVQIFPHGYEARCTPCERRARFEGATAA